MLRVARKPVRERFGKAPAFGDIALADPGHDLIDRVQHGRMFVHVAFTRGKFGLLHPGVLDAKVLVRVRRQTPQVRQQVRVRASLDQSDQGHQLAMFVVHRAETQQEAVVPGDGQGCDRCVVRHGHGSTGGAEF